MPKHLFLPVLDKKLYVESINIYPYTAPPTLVFLHEGLGSVAQWKGFPALLCQTTGLNGILYDRQGHGRSEPMTGQRQPDYLHVEALAYLPRLLQILHIEYPILIGHSDGGTMALLYAAFYKDTPAIVTMAAHVKVEAITRSGIQAVVSRYRDGHLKKKLSRYHHENTEALFGAWANTWLHDDFRHWNIEPRLAHIDCPSLIIQGEQDEFASKQHFEDIVTGLNAKATPLFLAGCGHTPHLEAPELVLERVANWVLSIF